MKNRKILTFIVMFMVVLNSSTVFAHYPESFYDSLGAQGAWKVRKDHYAYATNGYRFWDQDAEDALFIPVSWAKSYWGTVINNFQRDDNAFMHYFQLDLCTNTVNPGETVNAGLSTWYIIIYKTPFDNYTPTQKEIVVAHEIGQHMV